MLEAIAKKTCLSGKPIYTTEEEAKIAARERMLFGNAPQLYTYFCLLCYNYHLTSKAPRN